MDKFHSMPKSKPNSNQDEFKFDSPLLQNKIKKWDIEISKLSYEEALNALDILLQDLQADNFPIEELQSKHLKGKLYLKHCEKLLNNLEQEIIELDLNNKTS